MPMGMGPQGNQGMPVDMSMTDEERHSMAGNMTQAQHTQEHYATHPGGLENDMGGPLSRAKAREILHDGTVHGKPLTGRQRRYMGAVASGKARK